MDDEEHASKRQADGSKAEAIRIWRAGWKAANAGPGNDGATPFHEITERDGLAESAGGRRQVEWVG